MLPIGCCLPLLSTAAHCSVRSSFSFLQSTWRTLLYVLARTALGSTWRSDVALLLLFRKPFAVSAVRRGRAG